METMNLGESSSRNRQDASPRKTSKATISAGAIRRNVAHVGPAIAMSDN